MTTLFISDLHLDPGEPAITRQLLRLLDGEARRADALYILGDLFEVWLGDDDPDPAAREVVTALRRLTDAGVPCYVMHGNRDFLIGRRFCRETGAVLLDDSTVVDLHGERVLLMHGDTLCTDDTSYQRLRRIVRNPVVKWVFRRMSLDRRRALAQKMREGSRMHVGSTAPEIMDVNRDAVADAFRRTGVRTLIHGHTHRPAVHELVVDGSPVRRIVLGDWHTQGSVLAWSADDHFELRSLPR
ncbi:MAG TPA: UDP-2,3-diacylglucosamine diphosphatase [Steroidobacteraceae bacterium]|nr:UDP-2,3-diacylglucosamine diphosphatase [Steroidobacteraceae bacterium]